MHRRRIQGCPAGIAFGGGVAVPVAIADRGDRPPKVVMKLRVPVGDEGIRDAHSQEREQSSVFGQAQLLCRRELPRSIAPGRTEVGLGPEAHRVGLLLRPLWTLAASVLLGFIVV